MQPTVKHNLDLSDLGQPAGTGFSHFGFLAVTCKKLPSPNRLSLPFSRAAGTSFSHPGFLAVVRVGCPTWYSGTGARNPPEVQETQKMQEIPTSRWETCTPRSGSTDPQVVLVVLFFTKKGECARNPPPCKKPTLEFLASQNHARNSPPCKKPGQGFLA